MWNLADRVVKAVSDVTVGTVIVLVHVALADRTRKASNSTGQQRPQLYHVLREILRGRAKIAVPIESRLGTRKVEVKMPYPARVTVIPTRQDAIGKDFDAIIQVQPEQRAAPASFDRIECSF